MFTTHEVLQQCQIESSKTLTRWHQKGLLPPPVIRTHPNGRGKIAYWPAWIVARIVDIKSRMGRGESLDEIAKTIDRDWSQVEKHYREQRAIAREIVLAHREDAIDGISFWAAEFVYEYLREIGVQRPGAIFDRLWDEFADHTLIRKLIELVREGYRPVIVITDKQLEVIPDFLLATVASDPKCARQPLLVVPIYDEFMRQFSLSELGLPEEVTILPVQRVTQKVGKKQHEINYTYKGPWRFELEAK